jgi:hypothetical protein
MIANDFGAIARRLTAPAAQDKPGRVLFSDLQWERHGLADSFDAIASKMRDALRLANAPFQIPEGEHVQAAADLPNGHRASFVAGPAMFHDWRPGLYEVMTSAERFAVRGDADAMQQVLDALAGLDPA